MHYTNFRADLTPSASLMCVSTVTQVYSSFHRDTGMLGMQICKERLQMEICFAPQLSIIEYVLRVSRNECMSHALIAVRTKKTACSISRSASDD
jgi:hypothetical protein